MTDAPQSERTQPMLIVAGLTVARGAGPVVREVDFSVAEGEVLALLGVNGAGKTSLLQAVMGLLPAVGGSIILDGAPVDRLSPAQRARAGLGYAPEGRRVFPAMTVRDNLLAACRADRKTRDERVDGVYQLFPQLLAKDAALAWTLSGGQQQMVAIGRALMNLPKVLLLDEPTLGLAPMIAEELTDRLTWIARYGTSIIVAEQNVTAALAIAQRAIVLRVGRIALSDDAARLAADPVRLESAMLGA